MAHKASTNPTGTGVFVHVRVTSPREPENRPPPASRLPSWVIGTMDHCTDVECESRIEGFTHRHVKGFPLAEYVRTDG